MQLALWPNAIAGAASLNFLIRPTALNVAANMTKTKDNGSLAFTGLTILALMICAGWWYWSQSQAEAQQQHIAEAVNALVERGEPVNASDLRRKWNEIRQTEPGDVWATAFTALGAVPPPTTDLPFVGPLFVSPSKLADPDYEAQSRRYLAACSVALNLFHNAPHSEETPPHRDIAQEAFSLFRLQVAISAMDEDWEAVCRGLTTQLALLKLIDNTDCTNRPARPSLSRSFAADAYFDIIRYCPHFSKTLLADVAEALHGEDYLGGYRQELRTNRVGGISVFTDRNAAMLEFRSENSRAKMYDEESLPAWDQLDLHESELTRTFDLYLELIDSLLDATESPLEEIVPLAKRIATDTRLDPPSAHTIRLLILPGKYSDDWILHHMLDPRPTVSAIARQSLCRMAVAATQFYHDHNHWPTPSELLPDHLTKIPIDPYSGRALIMREVKGRLRLYSVSHNGLDDGGGAGQDVDWEDWYDMEQESWDGTARDLIVDLSPPGVD
jgi:hypothetical protein